MFVRLEIDRSVCEFGSGCHLCVDLCPVAVFECGDQRIVTIFDHEDECTFCGLCVDQCPAEAIRIDKRYESELALSSER